MLVRGANGFLRAGGVRYQGLDVMAAASRTARSYWFRRNVKGPKLP